MSIQLPSKSINRTGTYEEVLFNDELYEKIGEYSLTDHNTEKYAYNAVTWVNDPLGIVQNHMATGNNGKRILMVQDSFGCYLSTYLALGVEEIVYLNLNAFTGRLQTYVEKTSPMPSWCFYAKGVLSQ